MSLALTASFHLAQYAWSLLRQFCNLELAWETRIRSLTYNRHIVQCYTKNFSSLTKVFYLRYRLWKMSLIKTKVATGSSFVKKVFSGVFFLGIKGVLYNITSTEAKRKQTLAKLGVLLRICLSAWDVDVFWIWIERTNTQPLCKIRYSGKDLTIFLGNWRFPLWCLFASLKHDDILFYP